MRARCDVGKLVRCYSLLVTPEAATSASSLLAKMASESAAPNVSSSFVTVMLTAIDFDETVSYVYDFMAKNGPFDGIMGFSQGACMAAVLGALVRGVSCQ